MSGLRRTPTRGQRGAAAVEMAIVLPLLLLAFGGIIDFGRAFMTNIVVTNASREGARAAVVSRPTDVNLVRARAESAAAGVDVASLQVTVTGCPAAGQGDATVTVSVVNYEWLFVDAAAGFFGGALGQPNLSSTSVMRCGG